MYGNVQHKCSTLPLLPCSLLEVRFLLGNAVVPARDKTNEIVFLNPLVGRRAYLDIESSRWLRGVHENSRGNFCSPFRTKRDCSCVVHRVLPFSKLRDRKRLPRLHSRRLLRAAWQHVFFFNWDRVRQRRLSWADVHHVSFVRLWFAFRLHCLDQPLFLGWVFDRCLTADVSHTWYHKTNFSRTYVDSTKDTLVHS